MSSDRQSPAPSAARGLPVPLHRLAGPIEQFVRLEMSGGILLFAAALAALFWANLPGDSYETFWTRSAHLDLGLGLHLSVRQWVNDGLMALFFFVVTLEIRREVSRGELRGRAKASLPVAAAVGGMVVPAAIYLAFNAGNPSARAWGIPMATDIAFALGVLSLVGNRVPATLRVFLLALAIVDDMGGIAVIALFYTNELSLFWLGVAALTVMAAAGLTLGRFTPWPAYAAIGCVAWYAVHESGIHPTIAAVALALVVPQNPFDASAMNRAEELLHPWTSYLVVPVFALANAGIALSAGTIASSASSPVALGAAAGLVVGKPLGILLFAAVAVKIGVGTLPENTGWRDIVGVALVAGVGFTVAIFMATLAFDDAGQREEAKLGVLMASTLSAMLGFAWLILMGTRRRAKDGFAEVTHPARRR